MGITDKTHLMNDIVFIVVRSIVLLVYVIIKTYAYMIEVKSLNYNFGLQLT